MVANFWSQMFMLLAMAPTTLAQLTDMNYTPDAVGRGLGYCLSYFVAIIIMAHSLDLIGLGDRMIERISDSAYKEYVRENLAKQKLEEEEKADPNAKENRIARLKARATILYFNGCSCTCTLPTCPCSSCSCCGPCSCCSCCTCCGLFAKKKAPETAPPAAKAAESEKVVPQVKAKPAKVIEAEMLLNSYNERRRLRIQEFRDVIISDQVVEDHWAAKLSRRPTRASRNSWAKKLLPCIFEDARDTYDLGFFKRLQNGSVYFGSEGVLFAKGYRGSPIGMMEDFIFCLGNYNVVLQMFMATRGHPFTRFGRKVAFFFMQCLAFMLAVIADKYFPKPYLNTLFKIVILSPLTVLGTKYFYYLQTCMCCLAGPNSTRKPDGCIARLVNCFIVSGSVLATLSSIGGIALLYAASSVAGEDSLRSALLTYFLTVTLTGFFYDILNLMTFFQGRRAFETVFYQPDKFRENCPRLFFYFGCFFVLYKLYTLCANAGGGGGGGGGGGDDEGFGSDARLRWGQWFDESCAVNRIDELGALKPLAATATGPGRGVGVKAEVMEREGGLVEAEASEGKVADLDSMENGAATKGKTAAVANKSDPPTHTKKDKDISDNGHEHDDDCYKYRERRIGPFIGCFLESKYRSLTPKSLERLLALQGTRAALALSMTQAREAAAAEIKRLAQEEAERAAAAAEAAAKAQAEALAAQEEARRLQEAADAITSGAVEATEEQVEQAAEAAGAAQETARIAAEEATRLSEEAVVADEHNKAAAAAAANAESADMIELPTTTAPPAHSIDLEGSYLDDAEAQAEAEAGSEDVYEDEDGNPCDVAGNPLPPSPPSPLSPPSPPSPPSLEHQSKVPATPSSISAAADGGSWPDWSCINPAPLLLGVVGVVNGIFSAPLTVKGPHWSEATPSLPHPPTGPNDKASNQSANKGKSKSKAKSKPKPKPKPKTKPESS